MACRLTATDSRHPSQDPRAAPITRTTDAAGNLVAYTDHDGNTTSYAYTCLGQLERITYPDGTSRSFTYTDDGQLDTLTRADGSVVQHDYTAAGRLERIHVTAYAATLPPEGHWSHDTHLTFDLAGQLTEAHTSAAAVAFTYDSLGRQTAETLTLDAALIPAFGSKTVTRTLDDGGRATALALPSGATVSRTYTPGDALQSLSVGATTLWSAQLAGSVPTTITRGNGLVSTWSHSPALLPVQVDPAAHRRLFALPLDAEIVVDLAAQTLSMPDGTSVPFPVDPFARTCLMEGIDELGYLLKHADEISRFEAAQGR